MPQKSLIVFDMDGVLIDVSRSYTVTVPRTAQLFFRTASGGPLTDSMFDAADLAAIQQSGGLNNDWDLTYRLLELLVSQVGAVPVPDADDPVSKYESAIGECDLTQLVSYLENTENPLQTLQTQDSQLNRELIRSFCTGDVGSGNIIKQMFQELYLGPELFRATYQIDPRWHDGEGLNLQESLLISADSLRDLSTHSILAIATGRTRLETDYALNMFHIGEFFATICNHDDCLAAAADAGDPEDLYLKPHPYMLNRIAADVGDVASRYYVGDLPDDMKAAAASEAEYVGIGLTATSCNPTELTARLTDAGATNIAATIKELLGFLSHQ